MTKIILDPGHGKSKDSGAVNGVHCESEYVLKIAKYAEKYLEKTYNLADTDVQKTRTDETFRSLQFRTDTAIKKKADVLVSFHLNSAAAKSAEGFETFVHTSQSSNSESGKLQFLIHAECMNVYKRHGGTKDRGRKQADFHMVREAVKSPHKIPSVLIEFAFISNAADLKRITNVSFQKEMGEAVGKGIASYLGLKKDVKKCPTCGK